MDADRYGHCYGQGGQPGYALQRILAGADGTVKQVLRSDEWKSISRDHVVSSFGIGLSKTDEYFVWSLRLRGFEVGNRHSTWRSQIPLVSQNDATCDGEKV